MDIYHAIDALELVDLYWSIVKDRSEKMLKLNVLVSYQSFRGQHNTLLRLRREGKIGLAFLDAQTFGMNPNGENPGLIDKFEEYKHVVKRHGLLFDHIASFDDRFNEPEHNALNYAEMRREFSHLMDANGKSVADKIVPVTHDRDFAAQEFLGYAQDGAKLIGIGSKPMVTDAQWAAIDQIRVSMNVRAHRFGNLGFKKLFDLKINSADSARYARAGMYGKEMWFWDDNLKKDVKINLRSNQVTSRHMSFLAETFGVTVVDMLSDVKLLWVVNMYCSQKVQEYLTDELEII